MTDIITEVPSVLSGVASTEFATSKSFIPGSITVFVNGMAEPAISETGSNTFSIGVPIHTGDEIAVRYAIG